jgi:hypothetical protein
MAWFLALGTAALGGGAGACVNPKGDYNDWISRTANAPTSGFPTSDASTETGPVGGFTQTYLMACTSELVQDDVKKATLFSATITYRPSGPGLAGTLDFSNQSLKVGATSFSDQVGYVATVNNNTVTPDGRCDVHFGANTIPGSADPVNPGTDIIFTDSTLHLVITSQTQVCGDLSGDITSPLVYSFDPAKNICIYLPSDGAVPDLSGDQSLVVCPYP